MTSSTSNSSENIQPNLGFPEPILYYLKKNASPKLLLQLMKTSKYFCFKEFPFLVIETLQFLENKWHLFQDNSVQILDLSTLSKPLWITQKLLIIHQPGDDLKLTSKILSKVGFCGIKYLRLDYQNITFKEFKFLISANKIEDFIFLRSHIEYGIGGDTVPMDEILACLPKIKKFGWLLDSAMSKTINFINTKKIINSIKTLTSLTDIFILEIPETFDFELFTDFLKANPSIDCYLGFDKFISIHYSNMLQSFANKIIENAATKYFPLRIHFPHQTIKSRNSLRNLYQLYISK